MKARPLVSTAALFLVVATASAGGDRDASTSRFFSIERSPFAGIIYFGCSESLPPESEEVTPEGLLIVKGAQNLNNLWITGHPLVDGREDNVVDFVQDLNTGQGEATIRAVVENDAFDGTWHILQRLTIDPPNFAGRGFGYGRGDLRGKIIVFTSGAITFEDGPCGVNGAAPVQGEVISFGSMR